MSCTKCGQSPLTKQNSYTPKKMMNSSPSARVNSSNRRTSANNSFGTPRVKGMFGRKGN